MWKGCHRDCTLCHGSLPWIHTNGDSLILSPKGKHTRCNSWVDEPLSRLLYTRSIKFEDHGTEERLRRKEDERHETLEGWRERTRPKRREVLPGTSLGVCGCHKLQSIKQKSTCKTVKFTEFLISVNDWVWFIRHPTDKITGPFQYSLKPEKVLRRGDKRGGRPEAEVWVGEYYGAPPPVRYIVGKSVVVTLWEDRVKPLTYLERFFGGSSDFDPSWWTGDSGCTLFPSLSSDRHPTQWSSLFWWSRTETSPSW